MKWLTHNFAPKSVRAPESLLRILVDNGPLRWVPVGTSLQIVLDVRSWA